ncbi:tubulin-tyrosine ligase family-domain-containing protein [Polychytrium aggregatum]|uniref:tubulin-tyrosine ligase family-domain-containing protein n=1 Tax=Polychytrium aggregatum TaxID=110093 RepID=UPI0022FDCCDA|nr:tubulin-tyrosine ligase family-domain-containing protein [Polychytrium aggregatum]KAI9202972.1 tubulin-tyrosine ligase family-domain-containing protein [Polychytrium aggregatum]
MEDLRDPLSDPSRYPLCYRMAESGPVLLREVLERRGWFMPSPLYALSVARKCFGELDRGRQTCCRFRLSDYESCSSFQRINHFPNTAVITKKVVHCSMPLALHQGDADVSKQELTDALLQRAKYRTVSSVCCTFTLPNDYTKFVRVYSDEDEKGKKGAWICKPADLSRGRGIFVFRDLTELTYDFHAVVQRYISDPQVISGYKYDIRCYVLVRSYNPLTIYLYEEGLTRFATVPYDINSLSDKFAHLTNTSINKYSPTLHTCKDDVGPGCKWTLGKLRIYFSNRGWDFDRVWSRMKGLIILTLLPLAPNIKPVSNGCFELYGFDILLDQAMKPWLLEVNLSPALAADTQTDLDVKIPLLDDVVTAIGIKESDGEAAMLEVLNLDQKPPKPPRSPISRRTSTPKIPERFAGPCFPDRVGQFTKIYPFRLGKPQSLQPTKDNLRSIVAEVRKEYLS